jgi:hypothetical protein
MGERRVSNVKFATTNTNAEFVCICKSIATGAKILKDLDHPALLWAHDGRAALVDDRGRGGGGGAPTDVPRHALVRADVLGALRALYRWGHGVPPTAGATEAFSSTGEAPSDAIIVLAAAPGVVINGRVQREGWWRMRLRRCVRGYLWRALW